MALTIADSGIDRLFRLEFWKSIGAKNSAVHWWETFTADEETRQLMATYIALLLPGYGDLIMEDHICFMDQGTRSCFSTNFCTMVGGSSQWWLGVELHLCAGLSRRVDYPASVPRPKQLHQEPLPPYIYIYIQSLLVLVLLLLTRHYLNDLPLSCLPCNPKHLNDLQKWFLLLQALSKNWITWTLSKIPYPPVVKRGNGQPPLYSCSIYRF